MHIEDFREYCLAKKGVEETFPFNEYTLVYKVMGKMFTLCNINDDEFSVNLKCDPERAIELQEENPESIFPGWPGDNKLWNRVYFERDLNEDLICELIDQSYNLVVSKLRKKDREFLKNLE